MAEELANGNLDVDAIEAYNTGDLYITSTGPCTFLSWIYDSGTWYKWGLSDTAPITSGRFSGETHYGIGIAPDAANRMKISAMSRHW